MSQDQLYLQVIEAIEKYLYGFDIDEVAGSEVEALVFDVTDHLNTASRNIEAVVKELGP